MTLLLNAFSLNMIAAYPAQFSVEEISLEQARGHLTAGFTSAVGHANTAAVLGQQLGMTVQAQRVTVSLSSGMTAIVGQYRGPRLAEGATSLPEGATIQWLRVTLG